MLSGVAEGMSWTRQQPCTVILNHKGYMMIVNTMFASNRAETCNNKYCGDSGKEKCVAACFSFGEIN